MPTPRKNGMAESGSSTKNITRGLDWPSISAASSDLSNGSDSRKRQSKKDDAIRQRMERGLEKKLNKASGLISNNRNKQSRRDAAGTVMGLKPSPALQIKASTSVSDAAQLMSARREDCVLVIDDNDRISGILTAKDLAFRVVSHGIDARDVLIEQVMTKSPLCVKTDTSATEALDLMVRKGFRHLPVMTENQDIAGILDITRCFLEAMEKLERAYTSSRKLYDALEGVQTELGSSQPAEVIQYVEALRKKMSGPNLASVLDGNVPVMVNVKTSVLQATELMRENNTTAVLVIDKTNITGIFTSKDVVLRVIAPGIDPTKCSVVRVMTPHPDVAPMDMSIQAALRKMHDGHYLNLPVYDADGQIGGMVDVLKLTCATLAQINTIVTTENEGPAWNKFWLSLDNDSESNLSDGLSNSLSQSRRTGISNDLIYTSSTPLQRIDSKNDICVLPTDSASLAGESNQMTRVTSINELNDIAFVFKFKSPSGKVHRVQEHPKNGLEALRKLIFEKLSDEVSAIGGENFALSYVDDEGDVIYMTADHDLMDAVDISRQKNREKVDIYVHHPDTPAISSIPSQRFFIPSNAKEYDLFKFSKPKLMFSNLTTTIFWPGVIATLGFVGIAAFILGNRR